jgi:hypothetical protein
MGQTRYIISANLYIFDLKLKGPRQNLEEEERGVQTPNGVQTMNKVAEKIKSNPPPSNPYNVPPPPSLPSAGANGPPIYMTIPMASPYGMMPPTSPMTSSGAGFGFYGAFPGYGINTVGPPPPSIMMPVSPMVQAPAWSNNMKTNEDSTSTTANPWATTQQDRANYESLFKRLDLDRDGFISGADAAAFLTKSGASREDLRVVWTLSDIDKDGQLDLIEFMIAVHITLVVVKKGLPVPPSLPTVLIPKAKKHLVLSPSTPSSQSQIAGPNLSPSMSSSQSQIAGPNRQSPRGTRSQAASVSPKYSSWDHSSDMKSTGEGGTSLQKRNSWEMKRTVGEASSSAPVLSAFPVAPNLPIRDSGLASAVAPPPPLPTRSVDDLPHPASTTSPSRVSLRASDHHRNSCDRNHAAGSDSLGAPPSNSKNPVPPTLPTRDTVVVNTIPPALPVRSGVDDYLAANSVDDTAAARKLVRGETTRPPLGPRIDSSKSSNASVNPGRVARNDNRSFRNTVTIPNETLKTEGENTEEKVRTRNVLLQLLKERKEKTPNSSPIAKARDETTVTKLSSTRDSKVTEKLSSYSSTSTSVVKG